MTSFTFPSASRGSSSRILSSSGPIPSMGEMDPPRTWYRPRYSRVRSMATTSLGSSTTQRTAGSRRGSRQIRQVSSSATLPHTEQNLTRSLTSTRTWASRRTSTGSAARRWNAMRCALFGPTPGNRPSSSIRSWTTPSYIRTRACARGRPRGPAPPRAAPGARLAAEPTGERAELLGGHLVRARLGVAVGGHDQVLEVLRVGRVEGVLADPDRDELTGAVDGHGDQTVAHGPVDGGLAQRLLRGHHLLLHLLCLLEQGVHVETPVAERVLALGHRVCLCGWAGWMGWLGCRVDGLSGWLGRS